MFRRFAIILASLVLFGTLLSATAQSPSRYASGSTRPRTPSSFRQPRRPSLTSSRASSAAPSR